MTPNIINKITTPEGKTTFVSTPQQAGDYFAPDVAIKLGKLLRSDVKNKYGDRYFPDMEMCGKTGTAEISDNPDTKPNALFVGYSQLDSMPFAIIVIVEDSSSGVKNAVPIASKVMKDVKAEYAPLR